MNNFPKKIAVVGVGLIGGSIGLGLKKHLGNKITILGSCESLKRAKLAKKLGVVDEEISQISDIPPDTTLIVLSTPVRKSIELITALSKMKLADCLIIDVGSTKTEVLKAARKLLPPKLRFIATHPMAGGEKSGFENATAELFSGKPWIICTDNNPSASDMKLVKKILDTLSARVFTMETRLHDEVASDISHAQLALSSILINAAAAKKDWKIAKNIASSSFREITRGASHDPKMKTDIVMTNRQNIINSLENIKKEIDKFCVDVKSSDDEKIFHYFLTAKKIRDEWLNLK